MRASEFLADVERIAVTLPAGAHVVNACADRYRFTVGFAAALLANKVSLLPSTHTPAVIRELAVFAPDVFCLTDDGRCEIDLPRTHYSEAPPAHRWPSPEIDSERLAAYVFTSGSTGTPLPYSKTWGRLVQCVRDGAERFGLLDGRSHTLVGTVPAQHMYGFESTVLLALQAAAALCAERPFYPADICSALACVPRPRILISTPVHLRTLVSAEVDLPAVDLILSATAPLSQNLAREVEQRFDTRLEEIYGSTETGQIATRRTADTIEWRLWRDVHLTTDAERTWAAGGHIEQRTPMCDVIEVTSQDRFLLHGRMADLVNIAGKRSSLAYLTHQLNTIPGVLDGAFFLREETENSATTGVTRVAAVVVAPGLDAASLTDHLRKRIDPVFLPRPLLFVDRLPRNATGKLPHEALQALTHSSRRSDG
ncbi:MAG TPA: AMP-binding protein [Steroidobacteraceae bacterium]|nr:AMP-binding protein [Steroidobacteraceae bacterium]